MGMYDVRCMVSGVSLKGVDAVLVLLHPAGKAYQPVSLGICGNYNRYGCIDMVRESANTQRVLSYFQQQLDAQQLTIDEEYLRVRECYPFATIENLLQAFERNINDGPKTLLNDKPIVFALIAKVIWQAVVQAQTPSTKGVQSLLAEVFTHPVANAIYADAGRSLIVPVREMLAVQQFLLAHRIRWQPAADPSQHYAEEMREYLASARRKFKDIPAMLSGLKRYEREVADLLEEE